MSHPASCSCSKISASALTVPSHTSTEYVSVLLPGAHLGPWLIQGCLHRASKAILLEGSTVSILQVQKHLHLSKYKQQQICWDLGGANLARMSFACDDK